MIRTAARNDACADPHKKLRDDSRGERRFAVVVNPRSARGRGARTARKVMRALEAAGAPAFMLVGDNAQECQALVQQACAAERLRGLILIGGDGLIGLIIQLPEARALPIGIVPAGSGNDFARQFGLSHRPSRTVPRIIAAEDAPRVVDLGVATLPGGHDHWFAGGLSVGFDAAINRRANNIRLPIGRFRYYVALLAEITSLQSRELTVSAGHTSHTFTGLLATVMNVSAFGGGIPLAPRARLDDGELDLVEVTHGSQLRVLSVLGLLARGKHESLPEVTITRVTRVRIDANDEVAYADGEPVGEGPFDVRIEPNALTLLA